MGGIEKNKLQICGKYFELFFFKLHPPRIRQWSAKVRTPPHYEMEQERLVSMKITKF